MMQLDDDSIMFFKLTTGELIIGVLDRDLTEENKNSNVLYVKYPAVIGVSQDSLYVAKYNRFSKSNFIILMVNSVVYVDIPSDKITELYKELLEPKAPQSVMDDEGMEHSVH